MNKQALEAPGGLKKTTHVLMGMAMAVFGILVTTPQVSADGFCIVSGPGSDCSNGSCAVNFGTCSGGACQVNVGTCANGSCNVNVETCSGGFCSVNNGDCNNGTCNVNAGTCAGGFCAANTGACWEGTCTVNPTECGQAPPPADDGPGRPPKKNSK